MTDILNDATRYFELKLFECGHEQTIPDKVFSFTPKDYYVVHLIVAGQGTLETKYGVHKLKKGDMFFIGPHELPHYYPDPKEPWTYVWLGFGGMRASEYLKQAGVTPENPLLHDDALHSARHILEEIYFAANKQGFLDLNALGLAYQLMATLIRLSKNEAKPLNVTHRHLNRAKQFIYNNFAFEITINDIAANVGVTPNYLSNIFQSISGISTKQFLISVRMERAKQLLVMSNEPIKDIGKKVGIKNALYFSGAFKKYSGLSPEKYRQREQIYEI